MNLSCYAPGNPSRLKMSYGCNVMDTCGCKLDTAARITESVRMYTSDLDDETCYLLRRAREEKEQAASALHPNAIAAHTALAERYKTRAFMAQLDADEHFCDARLTFLRGHQSKT